MQNLLEKNLVSTKIASSLSGYNSDYLGRLCRANKIKGTQVGRTWFIEKDSLLTFVEEQQKRKEKLAADLSESREKEYQHAQMKHQIVTQVGTLDTAPTRTFQTLHVTSSSTHKFSNPFLALALSLLVVSGSAFVASTGILPALASKSLSTLASVQGVSFGNERGRPGFKVTDIAVPTQSNVRENSLASALYGIDAIVGSSKVITINADTFANETNVRELKIKTIGRDRSRTLVNTFGNPKQVVVAVLTVTKNTFFDAPTSFTSFVDSGLLAYERFIGASGNVTIAFGARVRDESVRMSVRSQWILDSYARAVGLWSENSPIVAQEITFKTLALGDSLGTIALNFPAALEKTYDTSVLSWIRGSENVASTITSKEIVFGEKIVEATHTYQKNHLATIQWLGDRSVNSYDSGRITIAKIRDIPNIVTNQAFGVAGNIALALTPTAPIVNESSSASVLYALGSVPTGSDSSFFQIIRTGVSAFLARSRTALTAVVPQQWIAPSLSVVPFGAELVLPLPQGAETLTRNTDTVSATFLGTTTKNYYIQNSSDGISRFEFDARLSAMNLFITNNIDSALKALRRSGGGTTVVTTGSGTNFFSNTGIYTYLSTGSRLGIGTSLPSEALDVQGNAIISGTATIGSLNGPLQANNGMVSATSSIGVTYGGTGLTTNPVYGEILTGDGTGGYTLIATSSLGLAGSNFFSNAGIYTYLSTGSNLGIGTSSPGQRLAVAGDALISGNLTVLGNSILGSLTATLATITNAVITTLSGTDLAFTNATTTNATSTNLFATSATLTNATSTNFSTTNLTGTNALLTNATTTTLYTPTLVATNSTTTTLYSSIVSALSGTFDSLFSINALFTNSTTTNATSTNFFATLARITDGFFTNITATLATITNAVITTLSGTDLAFTNATTTNATSTNLFATSATLTNATSTNFSTTNLTSTNATLGQATSTVLYTSNLGLNSSYFTSLLGNGLVNSAGLLSVSTTSLSSGFFKQGGNSYGATAVLGTSDNNPLTLLTNNSTVATILTNGNFGIATTTPSEKLSVTGNGLFSGNISAANITGTGTATVGALSIGSLSGFLKATAGAVTTSLIDLSTDVTSTLATGNGGTGITSYNVGDLLYVNNSGILSTLPVGSAGQVLKVTGGVAAWGVDQTTGGGGGSSAWATTTDSLAVYPADTSDVVIIGNSATSTPNSIFEVHGLSYFSNNVGIGSTSPLYKLSVEGISSLGNRAIAGYFTATSTTASTFPYASTTALTVSGVNGLTLGTLNGPLQANNGAISATSSIGVLYGGTGLSSAPTYGQLLVGNGSGGYTLTATSSLGISTGTNYFTNSGASTYLSTGTNLGIGTTTPTSQLAINPVAGGPANIFSIGSSTGQLFNIANDGATTITSASASAFTVGPTGATNPTLNVDNSSASQVSGISIQGNATGGATVIQATDPGANALLSIKTKGSGQLVLSGNTGNTSSTGGVNIQSGGNTRIAVTTYSIALSSAANANASTPRFSYTTAADTNLTASTEANAVSFSLGSTRQHATGDLTTQRDFLITGSNHSFVGASVLTDHAILDIVPHTGSSANATITNTYGIRVEGVALTGTKTNSYGLSVTANSGASNNYAAIFQNGNVGIGTTSPASTLSVQGNGLFSGNISAANLTATGTATIGTLTGLIKGTSGVLSAATAGTDYENPLTFTAPLSRSVNAISIAKSTTSVDGYLAATDFTLFNNKISSTSLSASYPLAYNSSTGVFTTAFGTTTTNTYSGLNTFNGGLTLGTLNGPLQANNGVVSATSSIGVLYGGTGLTSVPTYGQLLIGNSSGGYTLTSTSTLGIVSGISSIGPAGQLQSGTTITFATTTSTTDGVTSALTITGSGNTLTFTPSRSGTLAISGGGTNATSQTTNGVTYFDGTSLTTGATLTFDGSDLSLVGGSITTGAQFFGQNVDGPTTPTYSWLGDTSTGIYHPANNNIGFNTGGIERLRIDGNGYLGIGTTSASEALSVEGNGLFNGNINVINLTATGTATIGTLTGLIKGTSGVLSAATAGTDYENPLTFTAPLSRSVNAISIAKATTGVDGYLAATDFTLFNNKISSTSLSASYPLAYNSSTGVFSTSFGTTTTNTYSGLNTFNGGLTLGTLNGPLQANNGVVSATSSIGVLYGGTGLSSAPTYGQLLVGNGSGGYTLTATSSLGISTGTNYFTNSGASTYLSTGTNLGIGTTTPTSQLAINPVAGGPANIFSIGSSTGQLFNIANDGATTITSASASAFTVGPAGATNPIFNIDTSIASAVSGITITGNSTGGATAITATDPGANAPLTIETKGSGQLILGGNVANTSSPAGVYIQSGGFTRVSIGTYATAFSSSANSNASTARFSYQGASDTGLAASTESPSVTFNFATRSHSEGAIDVQRDFRITPATHTFSAGSSISGATIASSSALSIDSASVGGALGAITNSYALFINNLNAMNGASTTNAYGLTVLAPTGATNNFAATFLNGNVGIGTSSPSSALSVQGNTLISGALTLGTLNGPLQANNGVVSATSSIGVLYGGTGLSSAPTYGQVLVGDGSGGYTLTATSSLGISGGGTNYFTNSGANTYLSTGTNLGIGSSTPWGQLSINPDGITGPAFVIGSSTATDLIVDNAGNVGIGTASPTETLTVAGTASFTGALTGGSTAVFSGNVTSNNFIGGYQSASLYSGSNLSVAVSSAQTGAANTTTSVLLLPGASSINYRMLSRGSTATTITANGNYASFILGQTSITEASSGTHPLLTGIAIRPLSINSGSATVATTSSLYIEDAASATVTGGNFSLYVANGSTWLNGTTTVNANVGIGIGTPTAQLHTTGTVRFENYASAGATVTTDASGNLSVASDERLKTINGGFTRGLADLVKLSPILYHWNAVSGLEQNSQYAGFSAQNVQSAIPEAVATGPNGYLTLADRPIIATAVNSIKELAGITTALGTTTSGLAARLTGIETSVSSQQQYVLPQSLTLSSVMTGSLSASNGITADSYTAPLKGSTYSFGSTTISIALPSEVLTTGGTEVDLYKLATYSLASVENLRNRTDLLALQVDSIDARVSALELGQTGTSTSGTGFSVSSLVSALDSFGILIQSGIAQFNTLVFRQIIVSKDADGTSSASSVVVGHGMTDVTVSNSLVHPSSKIFITFTSSISGSWHIAEKLEGSFRVEFAQAQSADVTFDYFIVQTEGQLATPTMAYVPNTPVIAPTPTPPTPGPSPSPGPVTATSTAPTVTLSGKAAVQIAQGGAFVDPGATATDPTDGDISSSIVVTGAVDSGTPGIYTLNYTVKNKAGVSAEASRIVTVLAPTTAPSTPPSTPPVVEVPPTPPPAPPTSAPPAVPPVVPAPSTPPPAEPPVVTGATT